MGAGAPITAPMTRHERKALAVLVVALPVTWLAVRGQLAEARATALVGLAAVYAPNLFVFGGAVAVAGAALFAPMAIAIGVMVGAFLGMCYFAIARHAALGSTTTGGGAYGWGGWDSAAGGGGDGDCAGPSGY